MSVTVLMKSAVSKTTHHIQELPEITIRQLEVFRVLCREQSYANAAIELKTSRAMVKKVSDDFEKSVGLPLFEESADRTLRPTPFAQDLLSKISPLSRRLRQLDDCVRGLHREGRIVKFAAAGEFFRGGIFTDFLARLEISDCFRPCFLRIEANRSRLALLNAECDVYFGVGIGASDRLDLINLCQVPWHIRAGKKFTGPLPTAPSELPPGKWWLSCAGDPEVSDKLLGDFHSLGAKRGRILTGSRDPSPAPDDLIFQHETTRLHEGEDAWPCYRFSAVMRKQHPYSELLPRLTGAAIP